MKYALMNFQGEILKHDLEWDGKTIELGMYAKIGKDYYPAADLWPETVVDKVAQQISAAQALVKQAQDHHAKVFYNLRNKLTRGEL